jgi:hypothetical protein
MTLDRNDSRIVDDLLSDFDEHETAQLRSVLLDLRSLSQQPAPTPSPALAAILDGTVATLNSRRRRGRRGVIFSLALVGLMGVGAGTAAAVSPDFRSGTSHVITGIANGLSLGSKPTVHPGSHPSTVPSHSPGGSASTHAKLHQTPSPSVPPQANGGSGKSLKLDLGVGAGAGVGLGSGVDGSSDASHTTTGSSRAQQNPGGGLTGRTPPPIPTAPPTVPAR